MDAGFRYFAEKNPDAVALIDPGERAWSRGELWSLTARISRGLHAAGIGEGDVIAVLSPNCAEYMAVYMAGLEAGCLVVPINWHLAPREIAFLLQDSGARAIFSHASLGSGILAAIQAQDGKRLNVSIGSAPGWISLKDFAEGHEASPVSAAHRGRALPYTSATTGLPKAVLTHRRDSDAELERIVRINATLGMLTEDDNVHLCTSMLYHIAPLGGAEVALQMGHVLVLVGQWDAEQLLRLIDRYRVTTTFMVPTMFVRLLKLPPEVRNRYSTESLHFVIHGAAPCAPDVKRAMIEWWGNVIWEAYAATEAQGTLVGSEEWLRFPGTVGKPAPGSAVKILDESGKELPPNTTGLVYILPQNGSRFEYRGDPQKTARSYRDGFVTVGDLGYLNEEGYLFLCDRVSNLIISSGMNIYPAEIETQLVQHPAVLDCAVLGEPHELLGEVPKAYVQLEEGTTASPALTVELLHFLGTRLSLMKLPKRIEYVSRIPRDPSGKLFKRLLREAGQRQDGTPRPLPVQAREELA